MCAHGDGVRGLLRDIRSALAEMAGATLAAVPGLERPFIAAGSWMARWSWPGTLYWESHRALVRRLIANGRQFRSVDVLGRSLVVDITDGSGGMRYFRCGPYEPQFTAVIVDIVRPGSTVIDIGANIGFFTVLAGACASPGGRVFAFEPHPAARARLEKLVALNGVSDVVTVSPAALSDRAVAAAPLFLAADSVLSTLDPSLAPLAHDHPFISSVQVPVATLDEWLEAFAGAAIDRPIDLIKIDVEGTEERVLRGMTRTLSRHPSVTIMCETSLGSAADEILRRAGFSVRALDRYHSHFGNYLYSRP